MFSVAFLNRSNYFYPLGNTPACTLTALLPPNQPAKLLSLGCGDLRHLLFTIHDDGRALDFTCCDLQPAIIARNVLLLSLILDDKNGKNESSLWDIYFHFKISEASLKILQHQSRKISSLAESLQKWHTSEYGDIVRFCDDGSLRRVREIWAFYSNGTQDELMAYIQKCLKLRNSRSSDPSIALLSSLGPAVSEGLEDIKTAHNHYWEHGTTTVEQNAISAATQSNPCFFTLDKDIVPHYGVDPLTGFHLATAYLPLQEHGIGKVVGPSQGPGQLVRAAKSEFRDWMGSFRKHSSSVVVRCFVGDALAFANLLQQQQDPSTSGQLCLYRDQSHFDPILLDPNGNEVSEDLSLQKFDIIDTSNLADQLGVLNLFTSARPLLKVAPWATIYTETLLIRDYDQKSSLDNLLCGQAQTISMLTGLVPVEGVTNTSATSSDSRVFLSTTVSEALQTGELDQQLCRLTWKFPLLPADAASCTIPKTNFEATEFAKLLHSIFSKMFEDEDLATCGSGILFAIRKSLNPIYQPGSFAAFLRLAKSQVQVDWPKTMDKFMALIESDTSLANCRNYMQELNVWLHVLKISPMRTACLSKAPSSVSRGELAGYHQWKHMPAVVAITLKVPRENIASYAKNTKPLDLGALPVECSLRNIGRDATTWEHNFVAIQLGFGKLSTSGARNTDSFEVNITDDPESWSGKSPLFLSFYIPALLLLQARTGVLVSFRLKATPPGTDVMQVSKLGPGLKVFQEASTEDEEHVYITRCLPGLTTQLVPSVQAKQLDQTIVNATQSIKRSSTASVMPSTSQSFSITSRADIVDQETRKLLQSGCEVKTKMLSPFTCEIALGHSTKLTVGFPVTVSEETMKTRIARKSSYIELQAQIANNYRAPCPFRYPVRRTQKGLVLWNMPYINLLRQPKLSTRNGTKLDWIVKHLAMMMSQREYFLHENKTAPRTSDEQLILNIKSSILDIAMYFTGVKGEQLSCFCLECHENEEIITIIILVSSVRLDLSNRTIVLDAAVVPLTPAVKDLVLRSLYSFRDIVCIAVGSEEFRLWQILLPQWSDRCRKAQHKPSCEYIIKGQVLGTSDKDQNCICSCGQGDFPKNFQMKFPGWDKVSKHATRAAISAINFSPLVEDIFMTDTPSTSHGAESNKDVDSKTESMKSLEKHTSSESRCSCCGKSKSALGGGEDLMLCSGCMKVSYCSKECQKKDWKSHKVQCKK